MHKVNIILKNNLEGVDIKKCYSVECGVADNKRHFDHHGEFSHAISPCNNNNIKSIEGDAVIYITHMDADTYVGILRLLGLNVPKIDLDLLELIDLNGSSVCEDKFNSTLLYAIGVGAIQREIKFPRCSEEEQDVTKYISTLLRTSTEKFIEAGKKTQEKSEKSYKECLVNKNNNIAFFSINAQDALDPSRAYEDGIDIVIVYRQHYKTISIYCNPKTSYAFAGKTIAGITFGGHPQACGSPRGVEFKEEDAKKVYSEII